MSNLETIETIVRGLATLPKETSYVEFKRNEEDPIDLGEKISGLSNSGALAHRSFSYLIWGVDDETHQIVGTSLSFAHWKKGGEDILPYWRMLLSPRIEIFDYELDIDGKHVLVLEIASASYSPTLFRGVAYFRLDSYTKPLKDFPETEKRLFELLNKNTPERRLCLNAASINEVEALLDLDAYYRSLSRLPPSTLEEKVASFCDEEFLVDEGNGTYSITVLGALLYAKNLSSFKSLEPKAIRFMAYDGKDRLLSKGRETFYEGYALSFEKAVEYILHSIQLRDIFENGIRRDHYAIPHIAVREAMANALMHQDLKEGYGPLVEIFDNRVEWSNPGQLRVKIDRIIDTVPKAENPLLTTFLRRIGIGDASGSGMDKMVLSLERDHVAAPVIEQTPSGIRLLIYRGLRYEDMSQEEKLLSLYDHAVVRFLAREYMTNLSLRERFGLSENAKYQMSRLINLALEKGLIKKKEETSKKDSSYLPYWA